MMWKKIFGSKDGKSDLLYSELLKVIEKQKIEYTSIVRKYTQKATALRMIKKHLIHHDEMQGVYLGDGAVLMRARVGGHNIAYVLDSRDRLFTPWFIVSGQYEHRLTNFFLRNLRRDSICVDVGTNFGYYTCLFGRFCPEGRVVGIEADQDMRNLAYDNITINNLMANCKMWHAAATDGATPSIDLYIRNKRSGNNSIAPVGEKFTSYMGEKPEVKVSVPTVTIDEVCDTLGGRIDFLKIDVEGAETLALVGAEKTIRQNPQITIAMEWSPDQLRHAGSGADDIISKIQSHDMTLTTLNDLGGETPIEFSELRQSEYKEAIIMRHR